MKDVTIFFNNDSELKFTATDDIVNSIEELVQQAYSIIVIEIGDEFVYIPLASIQRIHFQK